MAPCAETEDSVVALSHAQEQMWTLYELDRQSPAYSSPTVEWLEGELDSELMLEAIRWLGCAQHSLRTRYGYDSASSEAAQLVEPIESLELAIQHCDVGSVGDAQLLLDGELSDVYFPEQSKP